MSFAVNCATLRRPCGPFPALLAAVLFLLACLAGGCAEVHPIPDDGGGIAPGGPPPPTPAGQWTSVATGSFEVLKASGIDHYTLVFRDPLRPRLDMRLDGTQQFTARGSQTNTAQREIVEYTFNGSFNATSLRGSLTIVKKRSSTGAVFSTQVLTPIALKQRHETAGATL